MGLNATEKFAVILADIADRVRHRVGPGGELGDVFRCGCIVNLTGFGQSNEGDRRSFSYERTGENYCVKKLYGRSSRNRGSIGREDKIYSCPGDREKNRSLQTGQRKAPYHPSSSMKTPMENKEKNSCKKVGILGGTFNPVHLGHLRLAEKAMLVASLDQVLFIPSGISYMKNQQEIVPARDRMAMVQLAIQGNSRFRVSNIEIEKKGNSYSHETIRELQKQQKDTQFFFLTGADTVFSMENWKDPADIFCSVTVLAAYRTGVSLEQLKKKIEQLKILYQADIRLIASDHIDISSSQIRKAISGGISVHELLPQAVEQYIKEHHFYENGQAIEKREQGR